MFNVLRNAVRITCEHCGSAGFRVMQFTYGALELRFYEIDDRLRWDDDPEGEPGLAEVRVEAILESCPDCGGDSSEEMYEILVRDDVITSVKPTELGALYPGYVVVRR
ncbi:hypothetical protein [Herbidospora sp. RD11066]